MVGPAAEKRALVRHAARMFVTAASLQVPMFVVVLRKGYGLGAMAIGGGSFQRASVFAVAWRTASSAPWASRVQCSWASATSSPPSTMPKHAMPATRNW
jgi:acetyl-CoA carboxylase carboxyltransferase component